MVRHEDADDVGDDFNDGRQDEVDEDVSAQHRHAHPDAVVHHGHLDGDRDLLSGGVVSLSQSRVLHQSPVDGHDHGSPPQHWVSHHVQDAELLHRALAVQRGGGGGSRARGRL